MLKYYSLKKKATLPFAITWMKMSEKYAKGNKSNRERETLYDLTYVRSLKKLNS